MSQRNKDLVNYYLLKTMILLLLLNLSQQSYPTQDLVTLSEVINQFQNHNIAYYYDNSELQDLENLLQLPKMGNHPTYLINYDRDQNISKLPKHRLLNVVFLDKPYHFEKLTMDHLNHQNVVIITSKTSMSRHEQKAICKKKDIQRAKAVFFFGLATGKFSTCCYYCGKEKVTLKNIRKGSKSVPELKKSFNEFKDFDGYTFKICYKIYPPFLYMFKGKLYGPEWDILNTASKLLNFKFSLTELSSNSTCSSQDLLIEKVRLEEMDWAMGGISQTFMRTNMKNVEFARYIQSQTYMVSYEENGDSRLFGSNLVRFWYISNWSSLLLMVGGVVAIVLVIKLSLGFSKIHSASFGDYTIMIVLYLVEQQSTKLKIKTSQWKSYIKALFIFWLFTCVYLLANYKSVQASSLMTLKTIPNTVDDLIKKGYKLQMERDDFYYIKRHCQYLASTSCSSLLENAEIIDGVCGSIQDMLKDSIGFVQEEESMRYTALILCNLTNHQKQSLRLIQATVIPKEWHAWPFGQSAPYIGAFSQLISRMEAGGLIKYEYKKNTIVYNSYLTKTQFRRENKSLNMSDFLYPFGVLIVGYFISIIVFLKEVRCFKTKFCKLQP